MANFEIIEISTSDTACLPIQELDSCEICGHCDLMRKWLRQKLQKRPAQASTTDVAPAFPHPDTEA